MEDRQIFCNTCGSTSTDERGDGRCPVCGSYETEPAGKEQA